MEKKVKKVKNDCSANNPGTPANIAAAAAAANWHRQQARRRATEALLVEEALDDEDNLDSWVQRDHQDHGRPRHRH